MQRRDRCESRPILCEGNDMAETNEDRLDASGEDPVVEKASVAETRKALVVETREDSVAETRKDHPVVRDFENLQKTWERISKRLENDGGDGAASAASSFAGSIRMFADEAIEYSKTSLQGGAAFIERLRGAKSLESVIQIQSDYAKSAYAGFVAYLVKMSDRYCNQFKRVSTPIEKAAAKIESVKT